MKSANVNTLGQKSLNVIRLAAGGHAQLVNSGKSCLWDDADINTEQNRAMQVLADLKELRAHKSANNGRRTRPAIDKETFWFLDFILSEFYDFLCEGELELPDGYSNVGNVVASITSTRELLKRLAGIDHKEYALGPNSAYMGSGVEIDGLTIFPTAAAEGGPILINGHSYNVSFVEAKRPDGDPYLFLNMKATFGKDISCSRIMRLAQCVDEAYTVQNAENPSDAWKQEYAMFLVHLLCEGEIMVNPTLVDYDKMATFDKNLMYDLLKSFSVKSAFLTLRDSLAGDPEMARWMQRIIA